MQIIESSNAGVSMFFFVTFFQLHSWEIILPMFISVMASGIVFTACMPKAIALFPDIPGTACAFLGFWVMAICTVAGVFASCSRLSNSIGLALSVIILGVVALAIFSKGLISPD